MVGFSSYNVEIAIIFFSFAPLYDYYMENNTKMRSVAEMARDAVPSVVFRYLGRRLYSCRLGRTCARQAALVAGGRRACPLVLLQRRCCGRAVDVAGAGEA